MPLRTARPRRPSCRAPDLPTHAAWPTSSSATPISSRWCRIRSRPACAAPSRHSTAPTQYNIGLFRSNLDNDIAFINSVTQGRAFFANIGQTRRQGVDAGVQLKTDRWLAYIAYTHTDATFQSGFIEASGNNPAADADGNVAVRSGNRLPGIPANQLKLGVYYKATDKWTVGATAIAASSMFLFGDEANLTPQLPGYFTMNVSTTYQLTDNVQLFALGAEHHQRALLYVRHVLADRFGVHRAGARGDQPTQPQPRRADRWLRRGSCDVLTWPSWSPALRAEEAQEPVKYLLRCLLVHIVPAWQRLAADIVGALPP